MGIGRPSLSSTVLPTTMTPSLLLQNGCLAGCEIVSHLAVPVLAKRAFALSKQGKFIAALKDIAKGQTADANLVSVTNTSLS